MVNAVNPFRRFVQSSKARINSIAKVLFAESPESYENWILFKEIMERIESALRKMRLIIDELEANLTGPQADSLEPSSEITPSLDACIKRQDVIKSSS